MAQRRSARQGFRHDYDYDQPFCIGFPKGEVGWQFWFWEKNKLHFFSSSSLSMRCFQSPILSTQIMGKTQCTVPISHSLLPLYCDWSLIPDPLLAFTYSYLWHTKSITTACNLLHFLLAIEFVIIHIFEYH